MAKAKGKTVDRAVNVDVIDRTEVAVGAGYCLLFSTQAMTCPRCHVQVPAEHRAPL